MGKPTGFKEFDRKKVPWRLPVVRINDYDEIYTEPRVEHLQDQVAAAECLSTENLLIIVLIMTDVIAGTLTDLTPAPPKTLDYLGPPEVSTVE